MRQTTLFLFLCALSCACLATAGAQIPASPTSGDGTPAAAPPLDTHDARKAGIGPNIVSDQPAGVPAGSPYSATGVIQDGNSVVPFKVEALDLKRQPDGKMKLRLAFTNKSSGPLDATGQFTRNIADPAHGQEISGLYLMDPVSHTRFDIVRPTETTTLCSSISPALAPGERRILEAEFLAVPDLVKAVYVYFPHAAAIADVPVGR